MHCPGASSLTRAQLPATRTHEYNPKLSPGWTNVCMLFLLIALTVLFTLVRPLSFAIRYKVLKSPLGPAVAIVVALIFWLASAFAYTMGVATWYELTGATSSDPMMTVRHSFVYGVFAALEAHRIIRQGSGTPSEKSQQNGAAAAAATRPESGDAARSDPVNPANTQTGLFPFLYAISSLAGLAVMAIAGALVALFYATVLPYVVTILALGYVLARVMEVMDQRAR